MDSMFASRAQVAQSNASVFVSYGPRVTRPRIHSQDKSVSVEGREIRKRKKLQSVSLKFLIFHVLSSQISRIIVCCLRTSYDELVETCVIDCHVAVLKESDLHLSIKLH